MQLLENNHLNSCCICSQITGQSNNDLISVMLDQPTYIRRVILENEDFVVIPSLGALVDGHVIICPKSHIKSFALLVQDKHSSYLNIKQRLLGLLKRSYNKDVHLFEHGSAKESKKLICTVDHAHIHALPANVEILGPIQNKYIWNRITNIDYNLKKLVGNEEYLYYEAPSGESFVSLNDNGFQSQYLRQVFAKALRIDEWNWRNNPNPQFTHKIYSDLIQHV